MAHRHVGQESALIVAFNLEAPVGSDGLPWDLC
jgi:hypothetical protein